MTSARYVRLGVNFEPEDLVGWYYAASGSDVAIIVITCRVGTIQLRRCPREHVFWWPEGGRGVTEPLEKSMRRLEMLRDTCHATDYQHGKIKRFARSIESGPRHRQFVSII